MHHRRTAILFADVVGYSRLIERDEEGTYRALKTFLGIWSEIVGKYGGRVVNYAGDALLAEMPDAARTLRCAVEAQRTLKERNRALPVDRRLRFRVGINVGNVIADGDDIYGDGVNIAARLAGCAEAGGICISETQFKEIPTPTDLGFEFLGELKVKNIAKTVGAYKVLMRPEYAGKILGNRKSAIKLSPWAIAGVALLVVVALAVGLKVSHRPGAPASEQVLEHQGPSLLEKPSVAIGHFKNLTGDPEQDILAESIADGIYFALSKFSNLTVLDPRRIGERRAETMKTAEQAADDLGVRYLLHGTLRRSADRVRITTQLFDENANRDTWGGRYDADLKDVFSAENGVIDNIATGLWAELTQNIQTGAWRNEADSAEAYRLAVMGLEHYRRFTPADNVEAKHFFRTAVTVDPKFLSAWAGLGWTYFNEARYGWGNNPQDSLARATALAARILEIDESHREARALEQTIKENHGKTDAVLY